MNKATATAARCNREQGSVLRAGNSGDARLTFKLAVRHCALLQTAAAPDRPKGPSCSLQKFSSRNCCFSHNYKSKFSELLKKKSYTVSVTVETGIHLASTDRSLTCAHVKY